MKKITSYLLLLFASVVMGQTPMFFNTNVVGGQNSIPLSSGATLTWRKAQFFIPTGSLGAVAPGNNITKIYFQAGSGVTVTYPDLYVRLKTGIGTGFTAAAAGPFETGLTTVFHGVNFVMTTVTGNWYAITLQTPFLFDPTKPLYVEIEHNSPNAAGPTVCQNAVIPGPGNGRAWGDYAAVNNTGVGTNQFNFGIDVIPATPCTAPPPPNSTSPLTFTTCSNLANPLLGLTTTYSLGGLTYAWQTSTSSPVGPYTPVSGTLSSIQVPTLGVTTWYQAVVTCTNPGGGTTSLTPTQFFVAGGVTGTVPYYESFEGLQTIDRLPDCSWYAPNLVTSVNTYTSSGTNNRTPRTGNNFASFGLPSTNNMVYTHGLAMSPGITYSAAIWYATEYIGYSNWTSLTILVGSNQSPTGLVPIATVGPAISGAYKLLSGTFTVPSAGNYYIAIRATASSGSALYLSWDDLSVTIPCNGAGAVNSPTVVVTASSQTVCSGQPLSLTAAGATTYSWNNGSTTSGITDNPIVLGFNNYTVVGTNPVTGCANTVVTPVFVNPSPLIITSASPATVCIGQPVILSALGNAGSFLWSNGGNSSIITVTTSAPATFTVIGTGTNGCISNAVQAVAVYTLPVITANSSIPDACKDDVITLTALGANTYQWISNTSPVVLQGSSVNVTLGSSSIFTVTGTNSTNGCFAKNTLVQNINECTGIEKYTSTSGVKVYPNPTRGEFTVEFNSASLKTIEVMDLTGRIIQSNTSADQHVLVNLNTVANGIYYVKVISTDSVDVIKVVKQ